MLANGIFYLKNPKYNQKGFSSIYFDSADEAVQNDNQRLI